MAFRHNQTYYLVFPWAPDGNLSDLWKSYPRPRISPSSIRWLVQQCLGLADGLRRVHGHHPRAGTDNTVVDEMLSDTVKYKGIHGDIKPANVLCFMSPGEAHTLVLCDFGLTRFHSDNSIANIPPKNIPGFSRTYRAPEIDNENGNISQSYDIWGFGCLLLELVSWFLLGYEETCKDFSAARCRECKFPREDNFFTMDCTNDEIEVKVKTSVTTVRR
jgi:serine/threonine protein kinase